MKLTKAWIKTIWTMCLLTCALTASAQLYNAPKHKHGDWYMGIGGGFSQSMAENADATDFIFHQMPSFSGVLGHNFSPVFGIQASGSINSQVSR